MAISTKKRQFGRPVGQTRGRAFMASIGVAGLMLAALTFYIGYEAAYQVPGRGYYNLHAKFKDANNLANHYEVRMGGVRVGQVLNPHAEHGVAVVDLKLSDKFKPIPSDSKLQVRLRSAVGVRYLEILPGTSKVGLPEGATIPTTQVEPSVALDQVLGTFDPKTRVATSTLLRELGNGVDGRGTDLNDVVRDTPRLLTDLRGISNAITSRPGDAFGGFIHNGAAMVKGFNDARFDIVGGFRPERQALQVFTDQKSGVQGTLDEAGPTLATARAQLPNIDRLVSETADFATRARPLLNAAPSSLQRTTTLLKTSGRGLKDTRATLDLARRAVNPTLGLLRSVRPALPTTDEFLAQLNPQLQVVSPRYCEVGNTILSWGQFLNNGSTTSTQIRFNFSAARPEVLGGQASGVNNDALIHRGSYQGPCNPKTNEGSHGLQAPLPGRIVNAGAVPFNDSTNPPYETNPNVVSRASDFDAPGGR